jgi:mannose-6-phosphate isomerase
MQKIAILKNTVQEYAWGSLTAIPDLLGIQNPKNTPQAELWMGAHPKAPSMARCDGKWISLLELIDNHPEDILGKTVVKKFDARLPYLFKVLAAAKPLSIQAHPNLDQAKEGFRRENAHDIPLNAPHRNYRDDNHKPECICALTPFWALCGFRKISEILTYFGRLCPQGLKDELAELNDKQTPEGLKHFFSMLMTIEAERRKKVIAEATRNNREFLGKDPAFQWIMHLSKEYADDIGIFSPVLLNLIYLEPGQAIFLAAGQLHAYLDGVGIELMANSDNVLRGGLTPKHVDVQELLNVLHFDDREVIFLEPKEENNAEYVYTSPAEEFVLSVIYLGTDDSYRSISRRTVEILLCTQGVAELMDIGSNDMISLRKGMSVIIPSAVTGYKIKGAATFYKAAVPL